MACHHPSFLFAWQARARSIAFARVPAPFMKHPVLPLLVLILGICTSLRSEDVPQVSPTPAPEGTSAAPEPSPAAVAPQADGTGTATPATNAPGAPDAGTNAAPTNANAPVDPLAPPPDSGMGSPGQNPPPSDPNALIPPPTDSGAPSPINSAGNEEKERQDQKTKYYAAKVKADKEEALASLLEKSDKAKTDEGKRQTLREYYDLLAKRMKKIDPSISDWIDTMHAAYLRRIEQVRVEPSIPLSLPPVPDAAGSPAPEKSEKTEKAKSSAEASATPRKKRSHPSPEASPSPTPQKKSAKKPAPSDD